MADLKMPEINSVYIAGNLTKDPIYRTTSNGTPVANFTIASNRKFRDSLNSWQEDVCFIGVVAWNKLADSCRERLLKGSAVLVEGELQSRLWKTEDGSNRSIIEIKASKIQFLSRRVKNASEDEENLVFVDEEQIDFNEDVFDKIFGNASHENTHNDSSLINKQNENLK